MPGRSIKNWSIDPNTKWITDSDRAEQFRFTNTRREQNGSKLQKLLRKNKWGGLPTLKWGGLPTCKILNNFCSSDPNRVKVYSLDRAE
jgi:hypothetical protein